MICYENLEALRVCLEYPYHKAIAKERRDEDGFFWSLVIVFGSRIKEEIHELACITNADTYDELMIWCDMHDVKIQSIERLAENG